MSFLTDKAKKILGILDTPLEDAGPEGGGGMVSPESYLPEAPQDTEPYSPQQEKTRPSSPVDTQDMAIRFQKAQLEKAGRGSSAAPLGTPDVEENAAKLTTQEIDRNKRDAARARAGIIGKRAD